MRKTRVIVTRAEREADRWVAELRAHGVDAQSLPLIEIGPPPDASRLQGIWRDLDRYDALMFVSANAVEHFFAQRPAAAALPWQGGGTRPRAWAPGPGTRQALLAAGVPAAAVDAPAPDAAQFDSESLWEQVAGQVRAGGRVLLVRGADGEGRGAGREWLSARLAGSGACVEPVSAYVRRPPVFDDTQRALARTAAVDGSVWIFSSSEAVQHLRRLLPAQSWSETPAIATHPRIAAALAAAGFNVVCRSRPGVSDIVAALESFE